MSYGKRERIVKPSAREWFPILRDRLLASRLESKRRVRYVDEAGKVRYRVVVTYGAPTFRNVINEAGEHV